MRELNFFADYLSRKFGHAVYRIGLDSGATCPHRNRDGRGGCVFCSADGSRAAHLHGGMPIGEQVEAGVRFVTERYHAKPPYLAYFQAFTVTNMPLERLRTLLEETWKLADFAGMILATRPDCLNDDILDLLAEWNQKCELWVELGVQTSHDVTLKRINRGHDAACTKDAVTRLAARGIRTAAHLILGLPGETPEDELATARWIGALPFSAVKIHNLLILKGTELARMYAAGEVTPINEYEYAERLRNVIRELPDHLLLMRLSAEAPDEQILAPKWWMKKGQFLEFFKKFFADDSDSNRFLPVQTGDGSYTLYHPAFRQHFHSLSGAFEESEMKYLRPGRLAELLQNEKETTVLDVGFGLGFNASAAVSLAEKLQQGKLEMTSLEYDPDVLKAAAALPVHPHKELINALQKDGEYNSPYAHVKIIFGDARQTLQTVSGPFKRIFLDGFSPDANPELWTFDFIKLLKEKAADDARIMAYSSAYPVISSFLQLGFDLRVSEPYGRKRPGLAACLGDCEDLSTIPEKDRNIALRSTAGVPWRDPALKSTRDQIRAAKTEETARLRKEGMPKWFKGN